MSDRLVELATVLQFIRGASEEDLDQVARAVTAARRRADPVTELPPELLDRVFRHLTVADLGSSACVCRRWLSAVREASQAWRAAYGRLIQFCPIGDAASKLTELPGATEPLSVDAHETSPWMRRCCIVKERHRHLCHRLAALADDEVDNTNQLPTVTDMAILDGFAQLPIAVTIGDRSTQVAFWPSVRTTSGPQFPHSPTNIYELPWGRGAAITASANQVFVASTDCTVYGIALPVFTEDNPTAHLKMQYVGHSSPIVAMAAPTSEVLITASADWTVRVWQRSSGATSLQWNLEHSPRCARPRRIVVLSSGVCTTIIVGTPANLYCRSIMQSAAPTTIEWKEELPQKVELACFLDDQQTRCFDMCVCESGLLVSCTTGIALCTLPDGAHKITFLRLISTGICAHRIVPSLGLLVALGPKSPELVVIDAETERTRRIRVTSPLSVFNAASDGSIVVVSRCAPRLLHLQVWSNSSLT